MNTTTTYTTAATGEPGLLRRVLRLDAAISGASAVALMLGAAPIGAAVGLPTLAVAGIGVLFLPWAALLWRGAAGPRVDPRFAWFVIVANLAWVVASAAVLVEGLLPMTPLGWWGTAIVADVVALLAIAEFVGLRRER